jgi:hypothetical protein
VTGFYADDMATGRERVHARLELLGRCRAP